MDNPYRDMRKNLKPVMEAVIPASAKLALHLTGAAVLSKEEVARLQSILSLFLEAIDALP